MRFPTPTVKALERAYESGANDKRLGTGTPIVGYHPDLDAAYWAGYRGEPRPTHRLVIREADGSIRLDTPFAAASEREAAHVQADHWKPPYSLAEPGRYRSELYRMGEAKPYSIIG